MQVLALRYNGSKPLARPQHLLPPFPQPNALPQSQRSDSITDTQTIPQRSTHNLERFFGNKFCTQHYLLSLQQGRTLDACCPNVELHKGEQRLSDWHSISVETLRHMLKQQLDEDPDWGCTPIGSYTDHTERRSTSPVRRTVTRWSVKGQHRGIGKTYHMKQKSIMFFSLYRGLRFLFFLKRLTWPWFTSLRTEQRFATCSSWAGVVNVCAVSSGKRRSSMNYLNQRARFLVIV